ncbi:putative 2-aminoethylphosphonate ABC transporter substrate-binding protein [Pararhodospirillum oryzae]|uniref:Putative 2-aminoethylphosphonate ABC transporter substrate-binding protein n=1 Tax=Pararhodospirillum oryzae TaxID=478448 RepID=A0A512H5P2_9PROT|nr:putative 2-aminoethylphosphonate ABC transporter substrate-binding protein [Pararhodospirillum oryzae]GEO80763.1 putative 2-aminoethylphosphonate ABC transporter substrate-binding protein [Pararhodospirillum oryzae]
MRRSLIPLFAATLGLAALGLGAAAQARTPLTVYTAVEPEELDGFKQAFEADYPDIEVRWVRDSTGIITAKLLAEKDNPHADMIWGLAATSLLVMDKEGMLEPYAPKGLEALSPQYYDATNQPPHWVGQRAWIASLCVNTIEAEKRNLPLPATWADLTDPKYQGLIVMPNPASSGTGFLDVSSWIQMWGEEKAWAFMDGLHQNVGVYTHSGSKPCKMAAQGEFPIGISFAYKGAQLKGQGAPVAVITPAEGLGWDLESFALVKGSPNLDAARKLADWSVSHKANEMYNEAYAVVAMPGVAKPVAHFPENIEAKMIRNDFAWAAANRARILETWQTRYGAKSEPK